jgi:hypothetical protein
MRSWRIVSVLLVGVVLAQLSVGTSVAAASAVRNSINPYQSTSSFAGVSCTSATFCMAVGSVTIRNTSQSLAEEWQGTSWTTTTIPQVTSGNSAVEQSLLGVDCLSASFCIAVGTDYGNAVSDVWNGRVWTNTATASVSNDPALYSVSCASDEQCIAVGLFDPSGGGPGQPLIEDWDVSEGWRVGTVASPSTQLSSLASVSCTASNFCMAAGSYYDNTTLQYIAFTEFSVGTAWELSFPPLHSAVPSSVTLSGVSCTSSTSCVSVGAISNNAAQIRDVSYSWNGTLWTTLATPQPGTAEDMLESVSCEGGTDLNCEAVGQSSSDYPAGSQDVAVFWNGSSWSVRPSPSPQTNQTLAGVSCVSTSDCEAVGNQSDGISSIALAATLHSGSGSVDPVENAVQPAQFLSAVSCAFPASCLAVGEFLTADSDPPLAESQKGHSWTQSLPPTLGATSANLNAVSCSASTDCVAVGQAFFGSTVVAVGARADRAIVPDGGEYGLIESWNGKVWQAITESPGSLQETELNAVSCPTTAFCMIVGDDGGEDVSYVGSGNTWTQRFMPAISINGEAPAAVSCSSATDCEAVGGGIDSQLAYAERWNGKTWTVQKLPFPPGSFDTLSGVSCPTANDCEAVGGWWKVSNGPEQSLTDLWNGEKWTIQSSPTPATGTFGLAAVSCASPSTCLAVGPANTQQSTGGEVLSWNGTSWKTVTLPASAGEVDLDGVSETSSSSATIVGYKDGFFGFGIVTYVESNGVWSVG